MKNLYQRKLLDVLIEHMNNQSIFINKKDMLDFLIKTKENLTEDKTLFYEIKNEK